MLQDLIFFLMSSVVSFFAGRYTNKSKIYFEIYKSQIKYVYAPISFFFRNHPNYSSDSYLELKELLNHLIKDHIELFPEELLDFTKKMEADISPSLYLEIKNHTKITFENLKSIIGLPTGKFTSRWKIMSKSDKVTWFMNSIFGPAILILAISFFVGCFVNIANDILKEHYNLELFNSYVYLFFSSFVFGFGIYILIFKAKK